MSVIDRRTLLRAAALTSGAVFVGRFPRTIGDRTARAQAPDFDALEPIADLRDGIVRLHLPAGFEYRSFHDTDGAAIVLADSTRLPGRHDGMGAFAAPSEQVWLVRNHEAGVNPAFGPGRPYDSHAAGGATTVLVTPRGEVIEAFTSLNGTLYNSNGARTPWDSWISCETTVNGPDVGPDVTGVSNVPLEQPHGFIFEVPAGGQSTREAIRSAGRFMHDGAAFDPRQGILYLTEDNFSFPSGLYRYLPPVNPMTTGRLDDGGRLQMLRVVNRPNLALESAQVAGVTYEADWVDIDDPAPVFPYTPGLPAPTSNDEASVYVGNQGRVRGAAHFSRLEGAMYLRGEVYFVSTQGGGAPETGPDPITGYGNGTGQVWSYDPVAGLLTCRYQSPGSASLDFPDSITARTERGTVVICEDGVADNYIKGLTRDGALVDLALNRLRRNAEPYAPRFNEEFAGATFSPDGHTLFVNIQASQGISFAIWGPWGRLGV